MNGAGDYLLSYDSPNEYGPFPSGAPVKECKRERKGGASALPCVFPGYMTDFGTICPEDNYMEETDYAGTSQI